MIGRRTGPDIRQIGRIMFLISRFMTHLTNWGWELVRSAGRPGDPAGGRPDSRCGLEPFRRGDRPRARRRRDPAGPGPGPSRDGPLDDLLIRVGRARPGVILLDVLPRHAAQGLAPRPVLGEF